MFQVGDVVTFIYLPDCDSEFLSNPKYLVVGVSIEGRYIDVRSFTSGSVYWGEKAAQFRKVDIVEQMYYDYKHLKSEDSPVAQW